MGSYDLTLGVLLVGIFLNTYLFGIVTVQFITYYDRGLKDPWWIRLAVAVLLLVDVIHSAAIMYMAWEYFVTNFSKPEMIGVALWPYCFTPIATGLSAIITHVFLSFRIYRLTKLRWLFILFVSIALASFSTGVASGIKAWIIKNMAELSQLNVLVTFWLSFQMALDTILAIVMGYVLWKSKTGYRKTDSVIHRLIRGAIQTGIFSTIFACGDLICFIASPRTELYGMFAIPLGRIYTNTLMHTLNMRGGLQELLAETVELSTPSSFKKTKSIQIRVQDTVTTQIDGSSHSNVARSTHSEADLDLKLPVHETQSTTSEVVFAASKNPPA